MQRTLLEIIQTLLRRLLWSCLGLILVTLSMTSTAFAQNPKFSLKLRGTNPLTTSSLSLNAAKSNPLSSSLESLTGGTPTLWKVERSDARLKAIEGPSGSGGGNLHEAIFLRAFKIIKESLEKRSQINGSDSQVIRKLLEFLNHQHLTFLHLDDSTANQRSEPTSNALLIDLPHFLKTNPKINLYLCIKSLVQQISGKFSDPRRVNEVLNEALRTEIRVPLFLAFDNLVADAVNSKNSEHPGCRDRVQLQTDAFSGKLSLMGYSTGTCIRPNDWLYGRNSSFNQPRIQFSCMSDSFDGVVCRPENFGDDDDDDTWSCLPTPRRPLQPDRKPWIKISHDGLIDIRYVWCNRFDDSTPQELNLKYRRSQIVQEIKDENPQLSILSDIEKNILFAKDLMIRALMNGDKIPLSSDEATQLFLTQYRETLIDEIKNSKIFIDRKNHEPFQHFSESTWIETSLEKQGTIQIRPLPFLNSLKEQNIKYFIHWLGHEIAHHLIKRFEPQSLSKNEETRAGQYALLIEGIVLSQFPAASLLNLSLGKYFSGKQGCRDKLLVKSIDPLLGILKFRTETSVGHCKALEQTGSFFSKLFPKNPFPHDVADFELNCLSREGQTYCIDLHPQAQFSQCPQYVKIHPDRGDYAYDKFTRIEIGNGSGIRVHYDWCVAETPIYTRSHSEDRFYSKQDLRKLPAPSEE